MTKSKTSKKFKAVEKNAKDVPTGESEIQWEGEQVQANSETKLESDLGTGQPFVMRFFDFGANPETFRQHKPTAQQLFDSHRQGIQALLWRDGLKPYEGVEPRLMFSKAKEHYRFVITCIPTQALVDIPKTLSQLIK